MPESCRRNATVEGSGSAEEATKTALEGEQPAAAAPRSTPRIRPTPARHGAVGCAFGRAVSLDIHLVAPDNLVLRGKDLRPGGPTGTALGDLNITVGGDLAQKEPGRPSLRSAPSNTVRGTYEFQGRRSIWCAAARSGSPARPTINPLLDVTATRRSRTPASKRGCTSPAPRSAATRADEQSAARGKRHPRADRLQSSRQRARHGRAVVAGRDRRRHRHRLHRRAARRIHRQGARSRSVRDHDHDGVRGSGRRRSRSASSWRARVLQAAPAVRRTQHDRVPLEYQLARFLRLRPAPPPKRPAPPTASTSGGSSGPGSI